jgi:hypothetical protein
VLNQDDDTYASQLYGKNRVKDLKLVWDRFKVKNYLRCNTVIVDDNPDVWKTNPKNTLRIKPFELFATKRSARLDDKNTGLKKIIGKLKKIQLEYAKNPCRLAEIVYSDGAKRQVMTRCDPTKSIF